MMRCWQTLAPLMAALATFSVEAAEWQALSTSSVSYVSIKNNVVAENNRFTSVTGKITAKGEAALSIDLSSVETQVDIRNQRMREIFFEVDQYPEARITGQLSPQDMAQIDSGAPLEIDLPLTLSLHGISAEVIAKLRAAKVGQRLWVTTREPVLISAGDFGLGAGVTALQELAGLSAIASTVPVTIDIRFQTK